jgi:thioesterase domain-containing protein
VLSEPLDARKQLRKHLKTLLPSHLVPDVFYVHEELPRKPNGKLDHEHLLHSIPIIAPQPGAVSARNTVEQVIADIWTRLLSGSTPGMHDDFFIIGGHSLLALRLVHEINRHFSLSLPVRFLFETPTIAGQAEAVSRLIQASEPCATNTKHPPLVPMRKGGDLPPFFLVAGGFGGEAELLVYAGITRYLNSAMPFYGLRARGVDDMCEPHATVQEMAAEYVREIRRVQPHGPYYLGGSCMGGVVALETAQQMRDMGEEVRALIMVDSRFPTRRSMLRTQFSETWQSRFMPLLSSVLKGPRAFASSFREQWRISLHPTEEQRAGIEKVRIGRKYIRRMLDYRPRPYAGKITLLICALHRGPKSLAVWQDVAAGGLETQEVPGDHFTHLREYAKQTAEALDACLAAARETADGERPGKAIPIKQEGDS